ncbi:MAG: hypothetical protein KDA91_02080 [Planctomycetaceae bacterium]|nr:hypothetical protein [Planctomycetaceae bacterium]
MNNTVSIFMIGPLREPVFAATVEAVRRNDAVRIAGEFETIPAAIRHLKQGAPAADLTIVLQSYPEQFQRADIDQLISATIFKSLVCCFGPWCESDGRSAPHWPTTVRIPARFCPDAILDVVNGLSEGLEPLSPLASPEEVYAYRTLGSALRRPDTKDGIESAVLIGQDRALLQTVQDICREFGIRVECVTVHQLVAGTMGVTVPPQLAFVDQDGLRSELWLNAAQRRFPSACVAGLTWHVDPDLSDSSFPVIAKLNLAAGIEGLLRALTSEVHQMQVLDDPDDD